MMKTTFLAALISGSAAAAMAGGYAAPVVEVAPVAPVVVAAEQPTGDWTGFYAGLQYGKTEADIDGIDVDEHFMARGGIAVETFGFHLATLDLEIGLVTGAADASVRKTLATHGLLDCFATRVTHDDVARGKPAPSFKPVKFKHAHSPRYPCVHVSAGSLVLIMAKH